MIDLSGTVIRDYELRECLGKGAFGAVYRAFQPSLQRDVAIKVILPEHKARPDMLKRFKNEAKILSRLEHLHIVPIYDYWEEVDGTLYIVMRFMRGGTLTQKISQQALSLATTTTIITQIGQALAVAHKHGVIHRDIKPLNILLDEDSNAFVSDFGIAKDLSALTSITTTNGNSPFTLLYAAPEQVYGLEVNSQADVYALAVVAYECLNGIHPFLRAPIQHLNHSFPSLHTKNPSIPKALDGVLQQALAKKSSDRFATVTDFVEAFQRAISSPESPGTGTAELYSTRPVEVNPERSALTGVSSSPGIVRHVGNPYSAQLIQTVNDVPQQAEKLIGRDALMLEIETLLERNERVLLHGFGGMGKTVLAAEIVMHCVQANAVPILWLHADSSDAGVMLEALARPFNANKQIANADSDAKKQVIRNLLSAQAVKLVVLDDAADGKALKQLIDAIPAAIPVLVTSRQRVPVGPIRDVGELDQDAAIAVLNHYAHESFSIAQAQGLCQQLGYHAYALEIAGRTLQVDGLAPNELLQRIADAPHLLAVPEEFDDEKHESLKGLFDDSIEVLSPEIQQVFFAFGQLFVPAATPELLALCLHYDLGDVSQALVVLGRRALAKRIRLANENIVYYRIHDLAYSYAKANVAFDPQVIIESCTEYVTRQKDNLDALDVERVNILRSCELAAQVGELFNIIEIMFTLTTTSSYYRSRGHDQLFLEQLDSAIWAARQMGDSYAEKLHYLLGKRGDAFYDQGNLDATLERFNESLSLAQSLHLSHREVILLCVMSKVYSDQRCFEEAENCLFEAQSIANALKDDRLIARVLENQGYYYAEARHDYRMARQVFSEQVEVSQHIGDPDGLFFALKNLGAAEKYLREFSSALSTLQQALTLARQVDNRLWVAHVLQPMGKLFHETADRDNAELCFNEALLIYSQSGFSAKVSDLKSFMLAEDYSIDF